MTADNFRMGRLATPMQSGWTSSLLPGTKPPGEASGRVGLALVALGLIVVFSLLNASFFSLDNFVVIGVNSTSILIAVLGTSALLIAGYVDLSIGSMVALIGIVTAKVAVATQSAVLSICVGLGLGLLLGLVNGLLVRRLSISPLIVTLAMLALYGGLAFVVSSTAVYGFPEALLELGRGKILGVQYTVIVAVMVFVVGAFILTSTVIGLRIYAIGGDSARCGTLRHSGGPDGGRPLRRQWISDRPRLRADCRPSRQHHADHRRAVRARRPDRRDPGRCRILGRRRPAAGHRHRRCDDRHPQCGVDLRRASVMVAIHCRGQHAAPRPRCRPGSDRLSWPARSHGHDKLHGDR